MDEKQYFKFTRSMYNGLNRFSDDQFSNPNAEMGIFIYELCQKYFDDLEFSENTTGEGIALAEAVFGMLEGE